MGLCLLFNYYLGRVRNRVTGEAVRAEHRYQFKGVFGSVAVATRHLNEELERKKPRKLRRFIFKPVDHLSDSLSTAPDGLPVVGDTMSVILSNGKEPSEIYEASLLEEAEDDDAEDEMEEYFTNVFLLVYN